MIMMECPIGKQSERQICLGRECPLSRLLDDTCGSEYRGWELFALETVIMNLVKRVMS